jgi:hypothetical protein
MGVLWIVEPELRYSRCNDDVCNSVSKATPELFRVDANTY